MKLQQYYLIFTFRKEQIFECKDVFRLWLLLKIIIIQHFNHPQLMFSLFNCIFDLFQLFICKGMSLLYNLLPNYKTGKYHHYPSMLSHSHKPEILRLHEIESKQRHKFSSNFAMALTQLLPATTNKILKSSLLLMKLLSAIPDVYYTVITLFFCRRRLGEQYTYIAMYKQKHYMQEGVLLNKKTRLLLFLLEIVSRNLLTPLFQKFMDSNGRAFEESNSGLKKGLPPSMMERVRRMCGGLKEKMTRYLGSAQEIMSNVEWLILMVYMLDWNKHFTFIETLLGIRYVYTYKNDQIREVSYAIEGYLLLATFIFKAAKSLYTAFKSKQSKSEMKDSPFARESQGERSKESGKIGREKSLCRICYDDIKQTSSTKCGHTFCWNCIIKTLEISEQCPVCRSHCLPREVVQLRNTI